MNNPIDINRIRQDFPVLLRQFDGRPIVYLDSAATSLKPIPVIEALCKYYSTAAGGVNRSVYRLARETTAAYHNARQTVAKFVGAHDDEIIFVRNATEGINVVASGLDICRNGRIVWTLANHHSNLLPWWQERKSDPVGLNPDGSLSFEDLEEKLTQGASLLCLPQVSNAMSIAMPIDAAIRKAREVSALTLIDATQSIPQMPVNVGDLGCDFLVWSGHKMLAPEGIGVLYAQRKHLEKMRPWLLGGDMVEEVYIDGYKLKDPPERFEAGTPNVGGAIALAAAIEYLEAIGLEQISRHVRGLVRQTRARLRQIEGLELYGPNDDALVVSAVSFGFAGMAAHALALLLSNRFGIMVRSGYHCAQPFHQALGLQETVRASFYLYNTEEEVEYLAQALEKISASLLRS
jgi:cysteine desulfurase / selenocysteine lyase